MTIAIVLSGSRAPNRVGMMEGFAAEPHGRGRPSARGASPIAGVDYWSMANQGPAEALNQTVNTQPLMLIAAIACWRVWRARGGAMPAYFAGHSLGEYTALVAAGSHRASPTRCRTCACVLRRCRRRSPRALAASRAILGLDDAKLVEPVCAEAAQGQLVEPANFNSPGQVVIAGHRAAQVERGHGDRAKEKGAKRAVMLPMSAPSPLQADAPRCRAACAHASPRFEVQRADRCPSSHNRFGRGVLRPRQRIRQADWSSSWTTPCAGSRSCNFWPRTVLTASWSAARARCSRASPSASPPRSRAWRCRIPRPSMPRSHKARTC